ncbi:SGNH/GDSL hydrolase family protein [Isachenkonia alkalipeptolytica]|uniref:SGNH/GDSL hydrolase family protein n=1 Tax=Isachenkonia alkalipeptolytica TaxID=2565777 RepID=A0AA43XIF7_9CLOT|nr:GDSL-type esterase/lipase family protein [Isachenkonia alkalipeptolytica]NBG87157.1 SGNH/GDSL hydrolase family protein [Isachenkonia alkalipeptolytica]
MIQCFGDSITKGTPGVSYLKYLEKGKYQNQGTGGETVEGLYPRLSHSIKHGKHEKYIIQIGTNDILLPYLEKSSPKWKNRLRKIDKVKKEGARPSRTEIQFQKSYQEIVDLLKEHEKEAVLINIPVVGENLSHERNKKTEKFNNIIKAIAEKEGLLLVDFYAWQKKTLEKLQNKKDYFIDPDPKQVVIDGLKSITSLGRMRLSQKRNLVLTVDGVHLNDTGAKGLAKLVREKVK